MTHAMAFEWDGEVARPLRRFEAQAARELVIGEVYLFEPVEEAQSARDRAYHAAIREAWTNLPEHIAEEFPNPTDFRKYLLVKAGFCTTTRLPFASARAAIDALPLLRYDGAVVQVAGAVVTVRRPMSQKLRGGMSKEERHRSYQETQDLAASMIGVSQNDLASNAARAA